MDRRAVQVKIKHLVLKPVSGHRAGRLKEHMPLPIDTAVAALEDTEGAIALEFRITGTLDKDHKTTKLFSKDWWEFLRGASAPQRESVSTEKLKPSKEQEKHLRDLAQERMRFVTHCLMRDKRIKGARIEECNARYSSEEKEPPRIQFFLRSSSNQ